jgi:RNA polymerase sigma-70 factor (ECF subfamily)
MATPPDPALELTLLSHSRAAEETRTSRLEQDVLGLFDQFRGRLLRYLISIGLKTHDAEEIVQEVFLALFQHLRREKSRENLRGWVFRVAHNLGLKHLHSSRRAAGEDLSDCHADPAPNPEQQLNARQRRERLLAVFRALPEQDRWCLQLRAEGLRYREIAEVVGMSLGAVSMSLERSLGRLARADRRI